MNKRYCSQIQNDTIKFWKKSICNLQLCCKCRYTNRRNWGLCYKY